MAYLGLFIILALLPDFYIWRVFLRESRWHWALLLWLPSVALALLPLLVLLGHRQQTIFHLLVLLLLCAVIPKAAFVVFSLLGRMASPFAPACSVWGNRTGIGAAALLFAAALYGFTIGWRRVVEKRTEIISPSLPEAFDGYTIVQLSDLHIGTYGLSPGTVDEIVRRVNALHADAIVFTGDLVNADPEETTRFLPVLSRLRAKDGVFSILGNHDYCEYRSYTPPDSPGRCVAELIRRERGMGWQLLLNESRVVRRGADSIAIVGVENDGEPPFPNRGDLPKALRGLQPGLYKVLLSHDPTHWRREVLPETDIALTLSGHTHAMQLRVGGFSPSRWKYREWGGLYREGDRQLYVSTGTGSNVSFRLGAWPEIDILTLRRK